MRVRVHFRWWGPLLRTIIQLCRTRPRSELLSHVQQHCTDYSSQSRMGLLSVEHKRSMLTNTRFISRVFWVCVRQYSHSGNALWSPYRGLMRRHLQDQIDTAEAEELLRSKQTPPVICAISLSCRNCATPSQYFISFLQIIHRNCLCWPEWHVCHHRKWRREAFQHYRVSAYSARTHACTKPRQKSNISVSGDTDRQITPFLLEFGWEKNRMHWHVSPTSIAE